jgi:hypothetical protein
MHLIKHTAVAAAFVIGLALAAPATAAGYAQ